MIVRFVRLCCVASAVALMGCPMGVEAPQPAPGAQSCASEAECNGGATCGPLRSCVDGLCEAEPSVYVACDSPAR